ncbi:hypothetical protein CI111_09475 [Fusobacterium animalis]|uniref:Uncharacterized protein n=1 Tax=Fusobacterium animalis TaxID=76859 RepID=A0A2G9F9C9_9FUSO|nr:MULTISPECIES: hypothetical protein [Fusobacterium]EUB39088.1 hypothetical protein HMPREF1498_2142 [Fusobacterium sp. CM1]PIM89772.1 hypothetical protein CI111_09475 [Fusobacterium animalis]PIM93008.1 hypothetical protein CI114_02290 [Fusobacterium animalis]
MSRVWRLHTKPKVSVKNKLEDKVADEIMKRKIVAIGWTLREDIYNELTNEDKIKLEESENSIKSDFEKYKEIIEKNSYETIRGEKKNFFNGKVNANLIRLNNLEKDDLIWIRSKGKYYLGRVTEKSHYLYAYRDSQKNSDILKLGINNQFTDIEWYEVGSESDIPGRILVAFYQKETLIEIDEKSVVAISQIIYNKKDKYYNINNKIKNNKENFYDLLSPYDCEDLLYFSFYHKFKYVAIPSTNKTNTQTYEFVMLSPKNRERKIYIQVKKGDSEIVNLYLEDYQKLDGKVYLFTTGGKIYESKESKDKKGPLQIEFKNNSFMKRISFTNSKKKIYAVNPEALYEFTKRAYKDKTILMPQSILQWFEYLE